MKIIFVSSMISKKKNDYIFNNANKKPLQSTQKFLRLFCQGLVENNVKVKAISVIPMSRQIMKKIFWHDKTENENGIEYFYVPFLNIKLLRQICILFFSICILLKEMLFNKEEIYVVCDILNTTVSTIANILCKIFRIKCLGIITDLPRDMNSNILSLKINEFFQTKYDGYIILTKSMNEIVNLKSKPSIVIEGFADKKMNDFTNELKDKKKICIYAGGLSEKYGVLTLVKAFQSLNLNDYELHLYGYGDLEDYLEKLNSDKIKFFGMVPNEKIIEEEIKATLLINPRFTNEKYTKFSFPSKNIEYMASGTPVLTTKLGGMPSEYEKYVFLFDKETINGYKNKIQEILKLPAKQLHTKGIEAKKFVLDEKNNLKQTSKVVNWIGKNFKQSDNVFYKNFNHLNFYLSLFSVLIMMISYAFKSVNLSIFSLSMLFFSNFIYSIVNFQKISILFFFLVSFFTFSMGQYYFQNIDDFMYYKYFSNDIVFKTIVIQFLSLFCICFIFYVFNIFHISIDKKHYKFNKKLSFFNSITLIGLIITILCAYIVNVESVIRVREYGYLVLYNGTHPSIIPEVIHYLSNSITVFLVIFLSTTNDKNKIKFVLLLYVINLILSLFTGARSEFVIGMFFVVYFGFKSFNYINLLKKKTIKKIFIYGIIALPILIVALNVYTRVRNKADINNLNPLNEFSSFFVSQGRSINVLNYAQVYENSLKLTHTNYTFGLFYQSLENKIKILSFGHLDFPIENFEKRNLAIDLSIDVLGIKKYKEGNGLGSNYLAELYIDFGIIGVILFSLIFAYIICSLNYYSYENWIIYSLSLIIFNSVMFLCRGQAMEFMCALTSFSFWLGVIFLNVLYFITKKCKKTIKIKESIE